MKAKLEKAIKGMTEKEIVEFMFKLFDINHRDALRRAIQRLEVEPKRSISKAE